jgi:hypothetical protein
MSETRHRRWVMDFARANAVLPVARARLFAIPGVHAVGIGRKIVSGEFTTTPAIMAFVEHKTPVARLDPAHVIPPEIDGVKTDVFESDIPRASGNPVDTPDPDEATERPLIGGIQIKPGNFSEATGPEDYQGLGETGSLGFFITIDGAVPLVYGVTNWHVVGSHPKVDPKNVTNLAWTPIPNTLSGRFSTTPPNAVVTPGTEVVVEVFIGDTEINAFYMTGSGDTAATVADHMGQTLRGLGATLGNGLGGTAVGGTLTLQLPSGATNVQVGGPFSPTVGDSKASPGVTIVQTSISPLVTTMTFSGGIDQLGGAYLTVNAGGVEATRGIFLATQSDIASAILFAINNDLNLSGVTAEPLGLDGITVKGAQSIKCQFTQDIRVGQPKNRFCTSSCSRCCDRRIGIVTFARLDLELGLIQLDAGLQYGGIIKNLGRIIGTHDVTQDTSNTVRLSCRGRSSPTPTAGNLVAFNVNGVITYTKGFTIDRGGTPQWQMMTRYFTNAFAVTSTVAATPFSRQGDSGTAIVTEPVTAADGSKTTTVAGLLFASAGQTSLGTPIGMILDAVSAWRIPNTATLVTADSMTDFKTVPSASGDPASKVLARVAHRDLTPLGTESARLAQVQREISATPGGQRFGPLIMRHLDEAQTLVNTNRKMATVWHRNGGPAITDALLRMLEIPGQRIPAVINGTPLENCLQQIASALARYGSDALAADIKTYGAALIPLAHLTYPELLTALA